MGATPPDRMHRRIKWGSYFCASPYPLRRSGGSAGRTF
jgi:hypothetical protein